MPFPEGAAKARSLTQSYLAREGVQESHEREVVRVEVYEERPMRVGSVVGQMFANLVFGC